MTPSSRNSTHVGHPAPVPGPGYEPPPDVVEHGSAASVEFVGEDGRRKLFSLQRLPLPGWHDAVAAAFAARVGPSGGRRTLMSAERAWATLGRFMRFLATLPDAPQLPSRLTASHVDAYVQHRSGPPEAVGSGKN